MKRNSGMNKIILSVAVVGLAMGGTSAFAQDCASSPPDRQSIHQAAESTEHAGSDTLNEAKYAGEGIVTR